MKRSITTALLLLTLAATAAQGQRRAEYTNPVAAGDYPDPSVIRVGRDYWATTTTSEWGPHFTLLHSRDLVNWRQVGVVFRKPPAWAVGSFWASEIAEDRGRFYIYYSARKPNGGPLCVAVATAARPQGPYTDRGPLVCQKVGSIDGFHVRDEEGRRFLLWKEDGNSVSAPTPIWAQRLSEDGTRLVGRPQELIRNTEPWEKHATLPYGDLVEGPAVVRRGGWFYMFYSGNFCCARECNYMVGVARSRKLLGPWEKAPSNPILAGNDRWKCPGHGTPVQTPDGRYYYLYHAMDAKDFVYVGRQAMLDEITWGADGWPSINRGRGPSARADSPHGARETNAEYEFAEEFNSGALAPGWQWPVGREPAHRFVDSPGGNRWLRITAPRRQPGQRGQPGDPLQAVLARPTTSGDYVATARVDSGSPRSVAVPGLAAFGDMENALGVSVTGRGRVFVWRREKNEHRELASADGPGGRMHLRMTAREGRFYRFAFSTDGRDWTDVGGEVDGTHLPPWDRGVRVALVGGGLRENLGSGAFDWLRIVPAGR